MPRELLFDFVKILGNAVCVNVEHSVVPGVVHKIIRRFKRNAFNIFEKRFAKICHKVTLCAADNNGGAHKLFALNGLAQIIYNLASAVENSVFGYRKITAEEKAVNIKRLTEI